MLGIVLSFKLVEVKQDEEGNIKLESNPKQTVNKNVFSQRVDLGTKNLILDDITVRANKLYDNSCSTNKNCKDTDIFQVDLIIKVDDNISNMSIYTDSKEHAINDKYSVSSNIKEGSIYINLISYEK